MSWLSIILTLLKVVDRIMEHVNDQKLIDKGRLDAISKMQSQISDRVARARAIADNPDAIDDGVLSETDPRK